MLTVRLRKELRGRAGAKSDARSGADEGRAGSDAGGGFTLDVEFDAPAGVTIIFGASGSGKSLTLRAVAGLLTPDSLKLTASRSTTRGAASTFPRAPGGSATSSRTSRSSRI
jgi:energy-coupling factor transporter ATP-binding protein EcfA2